MLQDINRIATSLYIHADPSQVESETAKLNSIGQEMVGTITTTHISTNPSVSLTWRNVGFIPTVATVYLYK